MLGRATLTPRSKSLGKVWEGSLSTWHPFPGDIYSGFSSYHLPFLQVASQAAQIECLLLILNANFKATHHPLTTI